MRKGFGSPRALLCLGLLLISLSACQESSDSGSKTAESPKSFETVSRADVESCLTKAGLQIDTGTDMAKVSGVVGIGVRSSAGGGQLLPRDQEAAVFVYPSDKAAKDANSSILGRFPEVRLGGNIVVVFAPKPSAAFLDSVGRCSFGLRSS